MNKVSNQTAVTAVPRELQAASQPKQGSKPVGPKDTIEAAQAFAGELMQAQAAATVAPIQPKLQQQAQAQQAEPLAKPLGKAPGGAQALGAVGEMSPLTKEKTTSLNTANAIAGLKPWSGEWVFEGMQKPISAGETPAQVKPLLDSLLEKKPTSADAPKAAQAGELNIEMLQSLQGSRGEVGAVKAASVQEAPQAAVASSDNALMSQLAGLNGSIEGINATGDMNAAKLASTPTGNPMDRKMGQPKAGASSLSGGEFLTTLGAVKAPQQGAKDQAMDQSMMGREGRSGLRVIEGGLKGEETRKGAKMVFNEAMIAPVMTQSPSQLGAQPLPPVEVTGNVVKGRMSQDRLSSESLIGMTTNIRNLSQQGAGEMRVRLRPDHLGELTVRVSARNGQVGLQIQASDENAKQILEESMSHLKESLAIQNLTLGSVDVSVAATGKSADSAMNQDFGQNGNQSQHAPQDMLGRNGGQSSFSQQHSFGEGRESDFGGTRMASPRAQAAMARVGTENRSSVSSGRLDVRA